MHTVKHILTDQEAVTLRDDLLEKYPLDPPTEPPVDPPVEPPSPINPAMDNRSFAQVFGKSIVVPDSGTETFPQKHIWVSKSAGISIAWKLPEFSGEIELRLSKSSAQIHGLRLAVFSEDRGFSNPLATQSWGTSALRLRLDGSYSGRTVYSNIRPKDGDARFDLRIQAYVTRRN